MQCYQYFDYNLIILFFREAKKVQSKDKIVCQDALNVSVNSTF